VCFLAKTNLVVEQTESTLGTGRGERFNYENVLLKKYFPNGNPAYPSQESLA
jgi:hypothetical protein